ncbi:MULTISPECIES: hypothetical protein [unclassified Streptomyces]
MHLQLLDRVVAAGEVAVPYDPAGQVTCAKYGASSSVAMSG